MDLISMLYYNALLIPISCTEAGVFPRKEDPSRSTQTWLDVEINPRTPLAASLNTHKSKLRLPSAE